jgi:phosphatidate cytidylyltransferase
LNNFITRALSGAVFVAILIGCVVLGAYWCLSLFLIITAGSLLEFYKLVKGYNVRPSIALGMIAGISLFVINAAYQLGFTPPSTFLIVLPLTTFILIAELYSKSEQPFLNIAVTLTGLIYVVIPFTLLVSVAFTGILKPEYHSHLLLGVLLLQWASDTGQYLFGMTLGKTKLFERISPKKSWEGFIGGFFFCVGIGYIISMFFNELTPQQWMTVAGLIVVFGTFGDLIESMLKRSVNIKDSGSIMPGHGGFLDRFDGVFGAMPFVYVYIKLFC